MLSGSLIQRHLVLGIVQLKRVTNKVDHRDFQPLLLLFDTHHKAREAAASAPFWKGMR